MILVDEIIEHPIRAINPAARKFGRKWCHMVSDTSIEELHEFATMLFNNRPDLAKKWYQKSHYDLTPTLRSHAIGLGAKEVDSHELVKRMIKE